MNTYNHNNEMYVFVASIRHKDGRIIYAKDYGKKAFRLVIRGKK